MNTIKVEIDKSEYGTDDFANYRIDNYWLDEKLGELYPNELYRGTIPTLLGMETPKEEEVVQKRILPNENETSICPILMCPDDCDFSCTLIVAEIQNCGDIIKWNKIGVDITTEFDPEKVGSEVEWFDKLDGFEFSKIEYNQMLLEFKRYYEIDNKAEWEK
ncbi:hypothetical protein QJU23_03385 [Pasteurella atlantica]|uniref:Uncharacterized protein n=2 Tax=Pasteurellaceae TaxID=712 RepID=A0ACC6HKX3_9PAST|nr:hypothetical protein [Pasteurella atlantica]MDP8051468.1 hypothetical protein [Pasteurella atlantica]MDP8100923.1 hypothetical protein [Pasteurella atlantica]MDP8104652.1 hypothetical protein [Pasteurella atlantica]MDP8148126.1 hypothetical protein [Pasteurella atlantica]